MIKLNFSVDEVNVVSQEFENSNIFHAINRATQLLNTYSGPYKLTIKKTIDEAED